ncbi:helix-turn-helix domain-containing protein [Lactobacillus sp. B4005]|uniref:helix-turn-helix domain-containing protein n=1 Tax=Lactobacillus sp. B4005 TaxID=2818031 RepID=UPI002269B1B7|nr:helix-turn-helix transcriptional regulator [Lactobacillus sp. B4005]MCX8723087.1 helix-turn-helix transcriptional regulator [Lactobacillus sp. B4005]
MNRLKELRIKNNLTLDDIEAKTGIKRGTYSNYENNKTEPKIETWQKLASFFKEPISYVMGVDDYEKVGVVKNE